ncbi:NAD(P)-binding domain-containing protein [Seohaeicola zhoushanensis]
MNERWDSLRLLTPNWQSRLPGFAYGGPDPDGFMTMPEIAAFLSDYAQGAPLETGTTVRSVRAEGRGYRVETNRGDWLAQAVVMATGACRRAQVPACASAAPLAQITPLDYKSPAQLGRGGVLVVGASATGIQLAAEIAAAGHEVMLAAGHHIRMPRHYRGRDIQWWMDRTGTNHVTTDQIDDVDRARRVPSLQLTGSRAAQFTDLNALQAQGIEITGRLADIREGRAVFSGSLANACALSDLKMNRLLREIDAWAEIHAPDAGPPESFAPTLTPSSPRLSASLTDGRFRTILWATGYAPDFGWLDLPVFDRKGRLVHDDGHVAPGLYVLGLPFQRRRMSALIDGVGADAAEIADHLTETRLFRAA